MIGVESFFRGKPTVRQSAPGRVNLLGAHTDYNDGYVLPVATPMRTTVDVAISPDDAFHFYSATLNERVVVGRRGNLASGFGRYIKGCVSALEASGVDVPALQVYVDSTVPVGVGLSSSAALEVATLRAVRELLKLDLDDVALARHAQKAEAMVAGMQCGMVDPLASSLCNERDMLLLDTRTMKSQAVPLPANTELLVIDSGIKHATAASKYSERRSECHTAAMAAGVAALRDVTELRQLDRIDEPYRRRARHVVSENQRVLQAAAGVSAARLGALMNESHASLRADYEVSVVELDDLTDLLRKQADVYGARLTGAGFGGACVALCRSGSAADIGGAVLAAYNTRGRQGTLLIPALQQQSGGAFNE